MMIGQKMRRSEFEEQDGMGMSMEMDQNVSPQQPMFHQSPSAKRSCSAASMSRVQISINGQQDIAALLASDGCSPIKVHERWAKVSAMGMTPSFLESVCRNRGVPACLAIIDLQGLNGSDATVQVAAHSDMIRRQGNLIAHTFAPDTPRSLHSYMLTSNKAYLASPLFGTMLNSLETVFSNEGRILASLYCVSDSKLGCRLKFGVLHALDSGRKMIIQ